MPVNRRQFLVLAGAGVVGGVGLGAIARTVLTKTAAIVPAQNPSPASSVAPSQPVTIQKTAIGPKGMFAPVRGDVRLAVISDLNSSYGSTEYEAEVLKAIELIPAWQPDIVLGGGDMVAGQSPSLTRPEIEAMWAGFERHIGGPLRKTGLPFGFTIGNHDASAALSVGGKPLFYNDRDLAAGYWSAHTPNLQFVDRAKFPFNYTFQHKDIFYLIWDASTSRMLPEQITWAEKALASSTAQAAKMRIAIGHLPLYAVSVGRDDPGEVLANAKQLADMLERYRVHTYISGHDHAYYPAHHGKLELLHASALGSGPRQLLNSSLPPYKTLSIVDIDLASESTIYTTYNMTTMQVVDHKTLPRLIVGPSGRALRLGVQESDLTAEERSLTYTPS